ncbi:uncharacterized protein LOC113371329 [Ctenocephalides felis]|uniref:uncharacterized protein LOC113371329 n=1 Tax=Ctenocephalides felis TaxID=7515 RepID=UPI000E6E2098|nr:uncharacterized protein LOC113371329 [Ctenocephalides felis]
MQKSDTIDYKARGAGLVRYSTCIKTPITFIGFCDTYESARKRAADSEYSSTEEQLGRGLRKKTSDSVFALEAIIEALTKPKERAEKRLRDESEEIEPITKRCSVPELSVKGGVDTRITGETGPITTPQSNREKKMFVGAAQIQELVGAPKEIISFMINAFSTLQASVDHILKRVIMIEEKISDLGKASTQASSLKKKTNIFDKIFLLRTVEEVKALEENLGGEKSEEFEIDLTEFVIRIVGLHPKAHIGNTLSRMFADNLAMKYSWLGRKQNLPMYNIKMIDIIKGVFVAKYSLPESEFDKITSEWLRFARQRHERAVKKLNPMNLNQE